jgi:hypothetical protein
MRQDEGGIDDQVFKVRIVYERGENSLSNRPWRSIG